MSKSWLVGLPVSVTLEDDGSVTVWVDLSEAGDGATESSGVPEQDAEFPPATEEEYLAINAAVDSGRIKYEVY